jgi:nitric oxide reductase NorE protein
MSDTRTDASITDDEDLPDFLRTNEALDEDTGRGAGADRPPASAPLDAPGEAGLWVFVLGDMSIFGIFFLAFMVENRADRSGFAAESRELLVTIGVVNTLVLLASSYLVVLAVHAHRAGVTNRAARLVLGAMACGALFAVLKAVEYSTEIADGHTARSSLFFTFYFILTGIHLLHVLIGTVLLSIWRRRAGSGARWTATGGFVEGCAVYWHMVDLLWIVIFTLVYLVVRS